MLYLYESLYVISAIIISELCKNKEDYNNDFYRIQLLIRACGNNRNTILINLKKLDGMSNEKFWRTFSSLLNSEIFLN